MREHREFRPNETYFACPPPYDSRCTAVRYEFIQFLTGWHGAQVNRDTNSAHFHLQSPIVGRIFQRRFRPLQRMAFGGLLWMAEIWRELALSVGCRSSQTFESNQ